MKLNIKVVSTEAKKKKNKLCVVAGTRVCVVAGT